MKKIDNRAQKMQILKKKLRGQIEQAFKNRAIIERNPVFDWDRKEISKVRQQGRNLQQLLGDEVLEMHFSQKPNQAVVKEAGQFHTLVGMAFDCLGRHGQSKPDKGHATRMMVIHELRHASPATGQEDLQILYGVEFYHDRLIPEDGFFPFLGFDGTMTAGLYRKMLREVRDPSGHDKLKGGR